MKLEALVIIGLFASLITGVSPVSAHPRHHAYPVAHPSGAAPRTASMPRTTSTWTHSRNSYRSIEGANAAR